MCAPVVHGCTCKREHGAWKRSCRKGGKERGKEGRRGGLLMKKVENERDSDGGNDGARRREKEGNGEATGRTGRRGGQTADNLAFIMCHRAVLVQHLHSHTRWI